MVIRFFNESTLRSELVNNPGYTSDEFLNTLYLNYGFNSFNIYEWSPYITISSPNNYYNVQYIKHQLELIDQVYQVGLDGYWIDGPSITHEKIGAIDEFVFGYGWGDCPSGCFGHHYWRVQVDTDCNVTLLEEFGDDLPE
ncbi:hypothetical protein N8987_03480 [Crocinitomix sp.]|nr:hypothetical protein [Crocinitomix sp.]